MNQNSMVEDMESATFKDTENVNITTPIVGFGYERKVWSLLEGSRGNTLVQHIKKPTVS
ncbi:MAG: hypothetical protein QW514_09030 [Thermoprotei archaeon]